MSKLKKLTEKQAEMAMDVLGAVEERKGFNTSSRIYSLSEEEVKVFKKLGPLVDAEGMILKLDAKNSELRLLKSVDEDTDETPTKANAKPKAKAKAKPKAKAKAKAKPKKAAVKKEEEPPIEREKPLSDKNPFVLSKPEEKDKDAFMIWIGYYSYPRIADYVEEALEHGFLKKVRRIPEGFEEGDKLFIAHNEGFDDLGVILGYVIPKLKKGKLGEYPKRRDNVEMSDVNADYLVGDFVAFKSLINLRGEPKTKKFLPVNGGAIMRASKDAALITSSPSSRAATTLKIDAKKHKSQWTKEDRLALAKFVKANAKNPNKFREFAIAAGRSVRSVEYQWYGPMKKAGMHK